MLGSNRSGQGSVRTASDQDSAGPWPGFGGGAPPAIGPSTAGSATTGARSDHTHPWNTLANVAGLQALASATFVEGTCVWVTTFGAAFVLIQSTLTVDNKSVVTAAGKAGFQWVRQTWCNPKWQAQATWVIDPTNSTGLASDEKSGVNAGAPLLTYAEHARRLSNAVIAQATAVSVLGTQQAGDVPTYTYWVRDGVIGPVTFTGTPAILFTSTVTSYTAMTFGTAAADDAQLGDTAVPGGSWTAAGALAKGVMIRRTVGGSAISCFALKDLGTTKLRVSQPVLLSALTAQPAFNVGDTYQVWQLPQLKSFRFTNGDPFGTTLQNFDLREGYFGETTMPLCNECYLGTSSLFSAGVYQNCCGDTGSNQLNFKQGSVPGGWTVGAFKGSGTTRYNFSGAWNFEGNVTCFQGARALIENGILNATQLNFYDTTAVALNSGTGGRVHFLGVIGGKGNTSKLAFASQASWIVSTVSAFFNLSSSSDAAPLQAGSTTSNTAIPPQTDGNGVFVTA